jgi:hypothetical protein
MTGRADGLNMLISRRGCFVVCSQVLRSEIGNAQLEVCFRMYSICTVVKWLLLTRIMQVQTILTPLRPASLVLGLGEINWLHRHASHGTSCLVGPVPACQASLQVSFPRRKRKTFLSPPSPPSPPSHLYHIVFSCSKSAQDPPLFCRTLLFTRHLNVGFHQFLH